MKHLVEINTFIDLFSYDPISTILNLMKYKKITQIQISNYIQINERNTRNYFFRKTKLNKHFLLCIWCILQLPQQISLELFKFSSFGLTLLDNGPDYFQFIKEIENYIIEQNINNKKISINI